ACAFKPHTALRRPEGRLELTNERGLELCSQQLRLKDVIARLSDAGITTSVFIDAEERQVQAAAAAGARVCEIHTGPYAHAFHAHGRDALGSQAQAELARIAKAGETVRALGMRFNAGHALNYVNVAQVAALPGIHELHIGHAIVSRAVFTGLREAVRDMKRLITEAAQPVR
ncbi:MAG: pyridoxine 5'-phosphate synthase, partial [Burkholderiales bacterium]